MSDSFPSAVRNTIGVSFAILAHCRGNLRSRLVREHHIKDANVEPAIEGDFQAHVAVRSRDNLVAGIFQVCAEEIEDIFVVLNTNIDVGSLISPDSKAIVSP